ncbi:MAG: PRC-barrel domain-containing protein [Rhodospirillaceae bacterium]|nr:PRC-barrel domain-containing protein [Rhodospirillales bacterium]
MRARLLSVTALAMAIGISGVAVAQQNQPAPPKQSQTQAMPNLPAGADRIVGKSVIGANGQQIGDVSDVLVDKSGKVAGLVMNRGGAMGVGGSNVVVPWNKVQIQGDQLSSQMTEQEVSQLPQLD